MFKKKQTKDENNMTYFIGGTAIGMAAGLLVRKVLSGISNVKTQSVELETPVKKNTNKQEKHEERPTPVIPFEAVNNDFENNMNDLGVEKKYTNVQKVSYNSNNYILHNINMEDNNGNNLSSKILANCKEEKRNNISQLSESINTKKQSFYVTELECNSIKNVDDKHYSKATRANNPGNSNKENTLRQVNIYKSIELSETLNNLSIDFYNDNIACGNQQNIKPSMINLNILPSYLLNASNTATCNDTFLQFEDEEDNKIVSYTSFDEYDETDVLSSTKQNDLDN